MGYLSNCVFVNESGFDINIRPPSAWPTVGTPAIAETKSTKAASYTILEAISADGVVDIELRVATKPKQRKDTTTGHYLNFIRKALDEMDKTPFMSGFYIVMDNAPIHTSKDVNHLIISRGYRSLHPSPYPTEPNPVEQFWSVVKNKVKGGVFSDDENLKTRIAAACNNFPIHHLRAFIQHSCNQFDNFTNKKHIQFKSLVDIIQQIPAI
ncbi:hypothetical protein G6F56_002928 [Rhizopus delemar]|nr:hypothetical protein G6F56_002928 [Rhizopus delemar]